MKKFLLSIFAFLLIGSSSVVFASSADPAQSFSDVERFHKYFDAIEFISHKGIVDGYNDKTYKPDRLLNRAELLKILIEANYNSADYAAYDQVDCFMDVPIGQWFTKYICAAKAARIVNGYKDNTFKPEEKVTLVEALKIALRSFGYNYYNSSPWYKNIVLQAEARYFIPLDFVSFDEYVSRGQAADLLTRMIVYGYGGNELTEYLGKKKDYNVTYDSLLNGVYVEGEMNDASSGEKQRFIDANIEAACLVYELDDYLSYDLETLVVDIFKNYGFDADDDDYMDDLVLKYENDSDVENALRDALEVCAGELFGDEDTMCYYMEEPYKLESSIELNDCASCVCREGNWACSSTCAEDTLYPSDVEDLSLTVLDDGRIKLRWDRAVDDTAVAGYQIHYGKSSVSKAGQTYDTHIDVGNVLTHYFTDLDEGTKYYFSVVAYDLEGSESLSWATEVSGVPTTKDTDPPDVISSESIDSTHVGVEFNEPIVLSTDPLRNFEIVSVDDSGLDLEISEVVLGENSDGIDDTYALLTTKAQENRKYTLTVSGVFDTEGNEIEVNSSMSVFEGTEELY